MNKKIVALVVSLMLMVGLALADAPNLYNSYKQNYGDRRWHVKLNALIDALSGDIESLRDSINYTQNYMVLMPVTPTYSSGTAFTLAGDYTSYFTAGKVVLVGQGTDGLATNTVDHSSYSYPNTTVTLTSSNLTSNLAQVWVAATRAGIFPSSLVGWIYGNDYGSPGQAALTAAIDAIGSSTRELLLSPGTWTVSSDTATESGTTLRVMPGAYLDVQNGVTLTINGPIEAGPYQIFSWTGTGAVVLKDAAKAEWFGLDTSASDSTNGAALQKACDSLETNGGIVTVNGVGTYSFTNFTVPVGVSFRGIAIKKTILSCTGEDYGIGGSGKWNSQRFSDFTLTAAGNTNSGVVLFDADQGATSCEFDYIEIIGKNGVTTDGMHIRGKTSAGVANNNCYNNSYTNLRFSSASGVSGGSCLKVGYDDTNCRGNGNYFNNIVVGGFDDGLDIEGSANDIGRITSNSSTMTNSAIKFTCRTTSAYVQRNVVREGCYFDGSFPVGFQPVLLVNEADDDVIFGTFHTGYNFNDPYTNIVLSGTYSSRIFYNWRSNAVISGATSYKSLGWSYGHASILPQKDEGMFKVVGGPTQPSGQVLVSGQDFTNSANILSPGGVGLSIRKQGNAALRVGTTSDGSTYTKLLDIAMDGGLSSLTSPADKSITAVSDGDDTLTITGHGLVDGQRVTFRQTGGGDPGNLTSGTRYYVIYVDEDTVKLANTQAHALAGSNIDISSAGSGTMVLVTGGPVGSVTFSADPITVDNPACNTTSVVIVPGVAYTVAAYNGRFVLTGAGTGGATAKYFILN